MSQPPAEFSIDYGNGVKWTAQPQQREYLFLQVDEALYGGAAGGGKSDTAINLSVARRLACPGSSGLILRRTLTELEKEGSIIPRSHELLTGSPGWKYNAQKKKWIYGSGTKRSVLEFGYCDSEADVFKYQSAQYDDILIDEATHFTASMIEYLKTRNRSRHGYKPIMRYFTNPGNIGHAYFKNNFVTAAPWGKAFRVPNLRVPGEFITRAFIHAKLADNPALMKSDPGYIVRLNMIPDESIRRALKDGDWDVFAGQYFSEWRQALHVVEPFSVPAHWPRFICMDWGHDAPSAVYWVAINEYGRAFVYRELYKNGLIASDLGKLILRMSKADFPEEQDDKRLMARYRMFTADPSIFAKKGEAPESIATSIQNEIKRTIMPAKNQRVSGWMHVHEWLALAPDGLPWMQFFSTCTEAIRTIPLLIHDDLMPEDVDTDGEDHAGDAIRYFSVMRHAPAKAIVPDPVAHLPLKDQAFWDRHNKEFGHTKSKDPAVKKFLDSITS